MPRQFGYTPRMAPRAGPPIAPGTRVSFWQELKRRNVFKVGAAYLIVAWLLAQVASVLAPALDLPAWAVTFVAFLLILAFPLAVFLAWAYEVTPDGIRRTKHVPLSESIRHITGQRLNYVVTGLLVVAVGYLLLRDYLPGEGVGETAAAAARSPAADSEDARGDAEAGRAGALTKSIAVIPFANLSPNEEDEYFALGIHDEILNQLVKLSSLSVISRTTMMQYAGGTKTAPEIGRELDVATVMEGSVRRAGDDVRVTVQLIDAERDSHLWSETYDGNLADVEDIFLIQANIATNVATALEARLSLREQSRLGHVPTRSGEAYGHYLAAMAAGSATTPAGSVAAVRELRRATQIDPGFAVAWAALADALSIAATWEPERTVEYQDQALDAALRALELDPGLPEAHLALSLAATVRGDWLQAESEYARGIELGATRDEMPAHGVLELAVGHVEQARLTLEANQVTNPLNSTGLAFLLAANEILGDAATVDEGYERGRTFAQSWPFGEYLMNFIRLGRRDIGAVSDDTVTAPSFFAQELGHLEQGSAALTALHSRYERSADANHNELVALAAWAAYYGDHELAAAALRDSVRTRVQNIWFAWLPLFDDVRGEPGFRQLVDDLGLIDYWREHGWPPFCRPGGATGVRCS